MHDLYRKNRYTLFCGSCSGDLLAAFASRRARLKRLGQCDQVAAGFFFFGLAVFGSAAGSDPRSIDVSRPLVNV
jgi:hypothetical protein